MPTYEYQCPHCNKIFEKNMTIEKKKKIKVTCPDCQSKDVNQLFFGFNILGNKTRNNNSNGGCCGGGTDCSR